MPIVLMESFDHVGSSAAFQAKGWDGGYTAATGRFGGRAWDATSRTRTKTLPASYQTVVVGVAMKYRAINDGQQLISLLDTGTLHMDLRYIVGTQTFSITRNGTTLGTFFKALTVGVWYYLEFKVKIDDTTGTAELKIDGVSVIALTGQDTRNGANATVNQIVIGSNNTNNNASSDLDDLYVLDASGSAPTNDFLGDVKVEAIFPNGNGNSSQLVGSDGNSTDNYLLVDEDPPNDDTDYVESSTVGDKDTYAYGNLTATTGTVYGISINPYAKKTDAGTRKIATVARLSGTEVDSADKTLSASYQYFTDIREAKPGGGVWTISDVNSAEFGVKVTA